MKKLFTILICALLILTNVISCDSKEEYQTLHSKNFEEKYRSIDDFNKIYLELYGYFRHIEEAYASSDKVRLETFEFSSETLSRHEYVINDLTAIPEVLNFSDKEALEEYQIKLELTEPVLRLNVKLAEHQLLIAAGNNENEAWFTELRTVLDEAYAMYYGETQ